MLTGKYNKKVIPADSRFALDNYKVSLFLDCIALFSVVSWYSMCSSTFIVDLYKLSVDCTFMLFSTHINESWFDFLKKFLAISCLVTGYLTV